MNRFWLIGIPAATVVLAAFLLFFGHAKQANVNSPLVISTPAQQNDPATEAEQVRVAQLQEELTSARVEAARNERKAQALATNRVQATNATASSNPLKDPELRATMEKQQLQAMDRKIKQLVNAKLIARLQLAPEQASKLRELLREKQRPATDFMTALMAGDFEESQIPEAGARVQQQIKDADAQIKALLGAEGYAYLDSEEKTDVERHQLRDMKSQFADGGHPLRPEQIEPLLAAMYDERQNFKFSVNFHEPASFDYTHFTDIFSEQNLERFYTESQQLNARIVTRVQGILDPEQVVEFERAIQERLERGHATVRMTQTLFPIKKRP